MEALLLMYYIIVMGVGIGILGTLAYKIWEFFKFMMR